MNPITLRPHLQIFPYFIQSKHRGLFFGSSNCQAHSISEVSWVLFFLHGAPFTLEFYTVFSLSFSPTAISQNRSSLTSIAKIIVTTPDTLHLLLLLWNLKFWDITIYAQAYRKIFFPQKSLLKKNKTLFKFFIKSIVELHLNFYFFLNMQLNSDSRCF